MCKNPPSVDQAVEARFAAVSARMTASREVLSRQGAVVASWRVERGLRMGPYFRLAFREAGRQASIYLGACEALGREGPGTRRVGQAQRRFTIKPTASILVGRRCAWPTLRGPRPAYLAAWRKVSCARSARCSVFPGSARQVENLPHKTPGGVLR